VKAVNRVVLCIKWGNLYPTAYVNLLFRAVTDHMTHDFRFICLTDDPEGLDQNIENFPIPEFGLTPERFKAGLWPKLSIFKPDLYGIEGRCLFIDLDSMIVGELEPLFQIKGDLLMIGGGRAWQHPKNKEPEALSGVFAFDFGTQSQIFDIFCSDKNNAYKNYENDTVFIEKHGQKISFWPTELIVSFKIHLCQPFGKAFFVKPMRPKASTTIVAFHGKPRPIDVFRHRGPLWINFPRFIRTPVNWVNDYWKKYGYSS
jgi:hypothetical protein